MPCPSRSTPEKDPVPIVWPQGRSGMGAEKLTHHRDAIPGPSGPQRVAIPTALSRHITVLYYMYKTEWGVQGRNYINPLTPKDPYSGRTAPLTSKRCILYIYSTNTSTEYFKHGVYCPFFSLQNAVCFIILTYLVPVLFTFYIQSVLKFQKNNSGAKRLILCIIKG